MAIEEQGGSVAERACVYSVLVGGYEELLEQPVARFSDLDFILFTDDRALTSESWQIRAEDLILPADPARSSRYAKLLPHRVLPEYDISIYIDNCVLLREPPETILHELFPDGATFALNSHEYRDTVRAEFKAVIDRGKDAPWVCAEQLEHYERWYPEVLDMKPLWTGFMIRRHHDPELIRAMELWWTQLLRYSRRDQLSIMVALREVGIEPTVLLNALRSSKYHEWPQDVGRAQATSAKPPGMAELNVHKESVDHVNAQGAIAEIEQLQVERDELAEQLQMMRDSTSWTTTAPLRWLGDRMRRGS